MLIYKFYLRDATKDAFDFIGILPERRMVRERITDESIVNWANKYFEKDEKYEDMFFIQTVL